MFSVTCPKVLTNFIYYLNAGNRINEIGKGMTSNRHGVSCIEYKVYKGKTMILTSGDAGKVDVFDFESFKDGEVTSKDSLNISKFAFFKILNNFLLF